MKESGSSRRTFGAGLADAPVREEGSVHSD